MLVPLPTALAEDPAYEERAASALTNLVDKSDFIVVGTIAKAFTPRQRSDGQAIGGTTYDVTVTDTLLGSQQVAGLRFRSPHDRVYGDYHQGDAVLLFLVRRGDAWEQLKPACYLQPQIIEGRKYVPEGGIYFGPTFLDAVKSEIKKRRGTQPPAGGDGRPAPQP
jgi:hypothetical protein